MHKCNINAGLKCRLDWIAYGATLRDLASPMGLYQANTGHGGVNVLVLRLEDLAQPHPELQEARWGWYWITTYIVPFLFVFVTFLCTG